MSYLMPKLSFKKTTSSTSKGVHTFRKGIILKVNFKAQLMFELTYYDVEVQHVSRHTMWILLLKKLTMRSVC